MRGNEVRKEFYVFRHGATDLNKRQCWQGSGMDYDLNEEGLTQASLLAQKLQGLKIEAVFSSPLKRALHTAEIVAGVLGVPVFVRQDLRECFYGEAEGRPFAETPQFVASWNCEENPCLPGGEPRLQALRRVLSEMEKLLAEPYAVMAVAIHRGTMAGLLKHFRFVFDDIPNCGVFHLVYDDGVWQIEGNLF